MLLMRCTSRELFGSRTIEVVDDSETKRFRKATLLIGFWAQRAGIFPGFAAYTFISVAAIVLIGGLGAAMTGTSYMGLGERISAIVIHQWLFIFALKLILA